VFYDFVVPSWDHSPWKTSAKLHGDISQKIVVLLKSTKTWTSFVEREKTVYTTASVVNSNYVSTTSRLSFTKEACVGKRYIHPLLSSASKALSKKLWHEVRVTITSTLGIRIRNYILNHFDQWGLRFWENPNDLQSLSHPLNQKIYIYYYLL
jgi:hypothetical protein